MARITAYSVCCVALILISYQGALGQAPASATAQSPIGPSPGDLQAAPGEHPLAPIIRWGKAGIAALEKLDSYSCKLVKRERVAGKLTNHQWMALKVRQAPFSVYAAFINKQTRPWQEVSYVAGHNGEKMFVHSDEYRLMGTVSMFPDADRAMRDNRYPLTEVGILNLIKRLVEHAETDSRFDDCDVKIYKDAKIESRPCLYLSVTHKERRPEFSFHVARIFIDNELNVPVRYEAYTWPDKPGGQPQLIEEYTYLDFQFRTGFTDRDFDINNPSYFFPPDFGEPEVNFADSKPVAEPPPAIVTSHVANDAQPLAGAIAVAQAALGLLDQTHDYHCLVSQRHQEGAQPGKYENLLLKVRHEPMGLYAFFLGPRTPKGQEAICPAGGKDNMVVVHSVGTRGTASTTRNLGADSPELVQAAGAPVNELGMKKQLADWLAMYQAELPLGDCTVRYYPQVVVDQRTATCVEVTHANKRPQFRYQRSRLYIDDQLKLPVRFEAYGWPAAEGQTAPLVEDVTYRNIETNGGLTDLDFDPANPNYAFGKPAPVLRTTSN